MIKVTEITKGEYLPITSGLYSPEILCERVTSSSSGDLGLIDAANSTSFYIGNKFNKGIVTTKLLYNSNEAIDSLEVYDLVGETIIDKRSTVDVSFDNGATWSTSHKQGVIYKFLGTSPKDGATQLKLRFNLTEEYDGSSFAWGTASSMNNARYALGGCGDSEKALSFGGSSPGITFTTTEKYLNNSWATTSSLNIARGNSPGCGDIYNALSIGGSNSIGSATSFTEKWNGTSWATTTALNAAKSALGGCGTVFSALSLGGTTGAASNTCEKWNGASWATTSVLNTARYFLASCGTSNSSLTFGGTTNTAGMDNTEKWSGTSWSTTSALNTARYNLSGCGDTTNALSFGGNDGVSTTEKWNSTSWVTTNALNVAKYSFAGCGTSTNALSFGGSSGTAISTSEKFSNKGVFQGFTLNIQKGHASSNIKAFLNLYSKGTIIDDVICEKFNVNTGDNSLLDLSNTTASYDMTNGYGYGVLSTNLLYASDTVIESLEVYDEINTDNAARATIDVSFDNGLSWATNKSQGVISDFTGTSPVNGDYLLKLKFNTPNGYSVFNTASSVWMTASNMNVARSNLGGCGTSSSALSFGGWSGAYINLTEKFNNTSWTTTSNLNQARYDLSGCGDTNSALSFGGVYWFKFRSVYM